MADNSYKINKSLNLNPQAGTPANPIDGDFFYDGTAQSFAYYHNGAWAYVDSVSSVAASEPLTSAQFTSTVVRNATVRITGGASPIHLDGMVASHNGKSIKLYNAGSDMIIVRHESGVEGTANNRIHTPIAADMNLVAGEIAIFTYDIIPNRWLLVSISSGAGAQAVATTSSTGVVTLHQASLFPAQGIVLSDGDIDTATGVVGLDANRAATIAAPLTSVTALTVTAAANASAVVINGAVGSEPALVVTAPASTLDFTVDGSAVQIDRRELRFSNDDGSANVYDNYMQYTFIGDLTRRGMKFVNETNAGTAEFWVEGVADGGNARQDLILKASTGANQTIANQAGTLRLGFGGTGPINAATSNASSFSWTSNSVNLWEITGNSTSGILQAMTQARIIRNVADPVQAQDVATRRWVATERLNYIINGAFDFWQRLPTGSTTFTVSASGAQDLYTADRWYYYNISNVGGDQILITQQAAPSSETDLGAVYTLRVQRQTGNSGTALSGMVQEFDRRWVKEMRGKSFTVRLRARVGGTFSGTFNIAFVHDNGGNENELSGRSPFYTGSVTAATSSPSPTLGGAYADFYLNVPALPTNITAASLQINHTPSGNAAGADWFELSLVQVTENTGVTGQQFRRAGDSFEGEEKLCQRFYERSYSNAQGLGLADEDNAHNAVISTSLGGNRHFGGPRYRSTKWEDATNPPTITFYDMAGNANMVTVNGVDSISPVLVGSSFNGFNGYIGAGDGADADLIEFHWAAEGEIR